MGTECFCFFFQAEDGIRDATVTGVQTCALPIFVPQVLGIGGVPLLVRGQHGVVRRHRRGPGCMAEAPGGPGTSTTGSSRSSNSVRRALDITACWKYSVVM